MNAEDTCIEIARRKSWIDDGNTRAVLTLLPDWTAPGGAWPLLMDFLAVPYGHVELFRDEGEYVIVISTVEPEEDEPDINTWHNTGATMEEAICNMWIEAFDEGWFDLKPRRSRKEAASC